jgi:hypothetical protein
VKNADSSVAEEESPVSLLCEALSEVIVGQREEVTCHPCNHTHASPGGVTRVIPPNKPEFYPSWLEWRVEITPDNGTPSWQKGLSSYIDPQVRHSLFRLYFGEEAHS